jgi:plasmid stability protein
VSVERLAVQRRAAKPTVRCNGLLAGFPDASIVLAGEAMATLTIRNVPEKVAKSLKNLAKKNRRSMEQEVRELISEHVGERASVLDQIQASWGKQARRPTATEVEGWISAGRE